jgi:hypothetical protein
MENFQRKCGAIMKLAKEAMAAQEPDVIILHLLDNSIYCARVWNGSTIPHIKTMDGAYHKKGEVLICDKDQQLGHFKAIKPILDLVDNRKGLLITPLLQQGLLRRRRTRHKCE